VWEQLVLPLQARKCGIDVLHSPGYTAPVLVACPSVVTIHDLNYFYYPEDFSKLAVLALKILVPAAARTSNKVITVSQNSKRDITTKLGIPPEKVCVIYEAAGSAFCRSVSQTEAINRKMKVLRNRHGICSEFILTVAASHPHKNLDRLIRAYYFLRKARLVEHQLVVVGLKGRAHPGLTNLLSELSLQEVVTLTGWVPDEDMPLLYSAADLFIFPSLFEGFGIPVLEAMACGTPVISSNATSLPEVVGDAGILIDPYDIEGMAGAMYELLTDDELRNSLVTKGLDRVKMFSWERAARETLAVYEGVYRRK
jgi:glycosyltransferase involved in cell wall biosynthesis